MPRRPILTLAVLALSFPAAAQSGSTSAGTYGAGTPGKGGFVPRAWIRGQPSVGSTTFKLALDQALGGATAGMFLGVRPADLPFLDLRLLVDLSSGAFGPFVFGLGGTAGTAGAGSLELPVAIPGTTSLVGTTLYFQWLVADSAATSGLVGSNGLRVTISPSPLVFAGGSGLIEYVPGASSTTAGPALRNIYDMHFDRTGTMGLVCSTSTVVLYDMQSPARTVLATAAMGQTVNCLAVHPAGDRAYVVLPDRTNPKIDILDIDRNSTNFGKVIGTISGLPSTGLGDMEGVSLSADGRVLAVAVLGLIGTKGVLIIDVDPTSTTRDTYVKSLPVSIGSFCTDADISPDGKTVYVCSGNLGPGSAVGRIDVASGVLLNSASAGDFAVDIDLDPLGRFLIVACPNSKLLTHVDLTPGANFFKATNLPATTSRFFSVALTPDGSQAIAIGDGSGTSDLFGFDMTTLTTAWSVSNSVSGGAIAVR
ncbi:MAG: hypothetical protein H6837_13575 [Planctomycetes bacterium]|nr:hypothetical protein [Planctomycetota bacterium]